MQIIVTMELEKDAHKWITYLSCRMDEQDMQRLLEESGKLDNRQDREYAESVLEVAEDFELSEEEAHAKVKEYWR